MSASEYFRPGVIEGYAGPMCSGKSNELLFRVDRFRLTKDEKNAYIGFIPNIDKRKRKTRERKNFIPWKQIPYEDPGRMFKHIKDKHLLVVIDEIQFFEKGIVEVVLELQNQMKNIIFAGLDKDFRREPFGYMKDLMFYSDKFKKLGAICPTRGCKEDAYFTQKLIGGKPAPSESDLLDVEGKNPLITYEPRCYKHHKVPGKQSFR